MRERLDLSPRVLKTMLFLLGLSGIAALFLPFTGRTSPWDVTGGDFSPWTFSLFLLGAPFLLAIPISAASLLLMITGRLVRPWWIVGYTLGFASAAGTLILACDAAFEAVRHRDIADMALRDMTLAIAGAVAVVIGASIVIWNVRHGLPHALNTIVAMQVMQVAGVAFALIWVALSVIDLGAALEIGAYFALVSVAVYIAHVALARRISR